MVQPINPPDGWTVIDGFWMGDFQRDTSNYLTSGTSVKMAGTSGVTQTLQGPWFPLDANGIAYYVTSVVKSTNNTSLLTIKLDIYAGDQTTLTSTVYMYNNAVVPTANVWQTASGEFTTGAAYNWARFVITRGAGETADVYIDRLEVKKLGPRWSRRKGAGTGQTLTTGGLQISFSASNYASLVTTSTTDVTVYRAGLYLLHFHTYITSFTAGDTCDVYFKVTDPILGAQSFAPATFVAPTGGAIKIVHTSIYRHAGTSGAGSPIGVWIDYGGGASPFISPTPNNPFNNEITAVTAWSGTWLGLG